MMRLLANLEASLILNRILIPEVESGGIYLSDVCQFDEPFVIEAEILDWKFIPIFLIEREVPPRSSPPPRPREINCAVVATSSCR